MLRKGGFAGFGRFDDQIEPGGSRSLPQQANRQSQSGALCAKHDHALRMQGGQLLDLPGCERRLGVCHVCTRQAKHDRGRRAGSGRSQRGAQFAVPHRGCRDAAVRSRLGGEIYLLMARGNDSFRYGAQACRRCGGSSRIRHGTIAFVAATAATAAAVSTTATAVASRGVVHPEGVDVVVHNCRAILSHGYLIVAVQLKSVNPNFINAVLQVPGDRLALTIEDQIAVRVDGVIRAADSFEGINPWHKTVVNVLGNLIPDQPEQFVIHIVHANL